MKISSLPVVLHLFLQTARLKKKRAVLTVASIAWGTVTVLLLLAFGQGFREQILKNEQGMGRTYPSSGRARRRNRTGECRPAGESPFPTPTLRMPRRGWETSQP
jgi:ABC-type antimicrobial peptide transport system permease subunit